MTYFKILLDELYQETIKEYEILSPKGDGLIGIERLDTLNKVYEILNICEGK